MPSLSIKITKQTLTSFAAAALFAVSSAASAGALNGTKWNTIDDKTGKKRSVVQFSEKGGVVSAKVIKIYNKADANKKCTKCKGALKNKPIVGLPFLYGFKSKDNKVWSGGRVIDPESGKVYKGRITLKGKNTLSLRGYVGIPTFGRSQTWQRIK